MTIQTNNVCKCRQTIQLWLCLHNKMTHAMWKAGVRHHHAGLSGHSQHPRGRRPMQHHKERVLRSCMKGQWAERPTRITWHQETGKASGCLAKKRVIKWRMSQSITWSHASWCFMRCCFYWYMVGIYFFNIYISKMAFFSNGMHRCISPPLLRAQLQNYWTAFKLKLNEDNSTCLTWPTISTVRAGRESW